MFVCNEACFEWSGENEVFDSGELNQQEAENKVQLILAHAQQIH